MLPTARGLRGFTLVELIVVILILGILAAVAVVGYAQFTERANDTRAQADLRQLTTLVMARTSLDGTALTRETLRAAMVDAGLTVKADDGLSAAAAWELGLKDEAPLRSGQVSIAFDNDDDHATAASDHDGARAAIVIGSDTNKEFAVIVTDGSAFSAVIPATDGITPAQILGDSAGGTQVPPLSNGVFVPIDKTPEVPVVTAKPEGVGYSASWPAASFAKTYIVATRTNGGTWSEQTQTATTIAGPLADGSVLDIRVKSVGNAGESDWSTESRVARVPVPPVTTIAAASGAARLTWAAVPGATSYVVERHYGDGDWKEATTTELTYDANLPAGATVSVRVRATGPAGESDWSAVKSLTAAPGAATLSGSRTATSASLTWTAPEGATRYSLVRTTSTVTPGRINQPLGVAADAAGNVFVTDGSAIRKVTPDGFITTYAGSTTTGGRVDGPAVTARFSNPQGLAFDADGNLYVADTGNHAIRKIARDGTVSTFAGGLGSSGSSDGTGTSARFASPRAVAVAPNGTVYVADTGNHTIRKITPAGVVTTPAGRVGGNSYYNGTGTGANFNQPSGIVVSANGATVYIADTNNGSIRALDVATNYVSTLAGNGSNYSFSDSSGSSARFSSPQQLTLDASGNVLVADQGNNRIRKVTPSGVTTTLAGTATAGSNDGPAASATFSSPYSVTVSGGNTYVADLNGRKVRKIASSQVTTLAGTGTGPSVDSLETVTEQVAVYTGANTSFTNSGLVAGQTYSYVVTASNAAGAGPASTSLVLK